MIHDKDALFDKKKVVKRAYQHKASNTNKTQININSFKQKNRSLTHSNNLRVQNSLLSINLNNILPPLFRLLALRSFLFFQDGIFVDHAQQVSHDFTRTGLSGFHLALIDALDGPDGTGASEEWVTLEVSGGAVFSFSFD